MCLSRSPELIEHFICQITKSEVSVSFWIRSDQIRQDLRKRCVHIIVVLEIKECIHQSTPFSFGDTDREQKQNSKIGGLFYLDPTPCEISRDQARWNSRLLQ